MSPRPPGSPRRLLGFVIMITIIGTAGVAPGPASSVPLATAAEATSDIPGVPLPGPIAAGRLGGAIYDVVYSFTVAPGHVIVASVTGTPGTDFDFYLFDATATTVLSTTGLLTKSAGPTSTESISWPSQFGGTYYIDLNGATDVEGDFRLTVQTVPDPSTPLASIALAGGQAATNASSVPVTITAVDDLSGVTEMALSPDGVTFEDWQPITPTTTWTFPPGDGTRTLWLKVRNGVGLESSPVSDSVVIDTHAPSVVAIDPAAGSSVIGLRPRFTASFDEPMAPDSWIELGMIVQSATGSLVPGSYAYDVATRTGAFTPSANLMPGATYVVNVGEVTDVAGNRVTPLASWSIVPLIPTELAVTALPRVLVRGATTRMEIDLTGAPLSSTLDVLSAAGSGPFLPLPSIATEDGRATLGATPASNTIYRFRYGGAFGVAPVQRDVRVIVRRSVVLAGRSSTSTTRARVGGTVKLTAAVGPAAAGVNVSFRLYRFDAARRRWVYAGSKGRNTDAAGRAVLNWVPPATGSWYWRVAVLPTVDFANNTSPVYRWSISR